MNAQHPMRRFLGLSPDSDPLDILVIEVSDLDDTSIREAVKRREAEIADHPDGESEDARNVLQHVHDAAQLLLNPAARMTILARHVPRELLERSGSSSDIQKLTKFDQDVLGILVASGGWNARSRARLMAVASRYGISNERLLSVMTGMATWLQRRAATARPQIQVQDHSLLNLPSAGMDDKAGVVFDRFVNRWMSDLRSDDPKAVRRMSLAFGSLALVFFISMLFLLLLSSADDEGAVVVQNSGRDSSVVPAVSTDPIDRDAFPESSGIELSIVVNPELPSVMTNAADGIGETTESLIELVSRSNEGESALSLHSGFSILIREAASCWFLIEESSRSRLLEAIAMVFDSIGSDKQALNEYMDDLRFKTGEFNSAQQIPESGFRSGVLSLLAGSAQQSPTVRSLATEILGQSTESVVPSGGFESGVMICLESYLPRMTELMEIGDDSDLQWYLWIRCFDSLVEIDVQSVYVAAIDAVIRESLNLSEVGSSRSALTRLLFQLDYDQSSVVRDMVLGWYADSDISPARLEILTRLLVELDLSDRFDESTIIQPNSGITFARQQRDSLARTWNMSGDAEFGWESPVPDGFDPVVVTIWNSIWDVVQSKVMQRSDASLLQRLLELRLLNEAASALCDGQNPTGIKLIREIEMGIAEAVEPSIIDRREPVSLDEWSGRLSRARTREENLKLLDKLKNVPPGSFNSSNAIQLANVAYLAASAIRSRAQEIIVDRFSDDPEVMIALLDSLPKRPTKELDAFLESLLDQDLPDIRSAGWRTAVKRVMVGRSLLLRLASTAIIDRYASRLSRSYLDESKRFGGAMLSGSSDLSIWESMQSICIARQNRLEGILSTADSRLLSDLGARNEARHRLAGDAVQASLMQSLFLFEILVLEWSVRLPSISDGLEVVLEDLKLDLPVKSHVLEQLVLVEEATSQLWEIVLESFVQRRDEREGAVG